MLAIGKRLARRNAQLQLDQIETEDRLGDRMLDLQARVHLEEIEISSSSDHELDRAGVVVVGRARAAATAASPIRARSSAVRPATGASSMIFW